MSLRLALTITGDSASAKAALAEADRAIAATAKEALTLDQAYAKADGTLARLASAQATANGRIAETKSAFKAGAIAAEDYNRELLEVKGALGLVESAHREAMAEVKRASGALAAANDNFGGVARGSKLAGHQVQNLGYQFTDLGIQLASGAPPMMAFMQQGGQIAGIMSQAGIGVGGLAREVAGMAAGFLAAHPLLLAAAAAAGLLALAVGQVTAEINANSAVTVTWQDVVLGAFDVVSGAVETKVNAAFDAMGINIGAVWDGAVRATRMAINFMIGAALAVPRTIGATYDKIGPAIGDAFYSGVNLAVGALQSLLDKVASNVNGVVDMFNDAFGTKIPRVVAASIPKIANPYAGAMGALGSAGAAAMVGSFTQDYVGDMGAALSDAATRRALARKAAEAGKSAGDGAREGMKGAGSKAGEDFAEELEKQLKAAKSATQSALKTLFGSVSGFSSGADEFWAGLAKAARQAGEEIAREAAENRDRALQTANDIAGIIGGGVGAAIRELADALDRFEGLLPAIGKALGGLNIDSGKLAGMAGIGSVFGGSGGGSLGGIAGGMAGEQLLGALGSFAGPLGSMIGGLLGGLLGGALSSTKRGSATFGDGGLVSTRGNSASRISGASKAGGSAMDAFQSLLDELGATASGISFSTGIRKKDFVLDPTGQGRTKGAGVLNFGQDEEAFLAATIREIISDASFEGLSEGFERLLKNGDDIEAQVKKVLTLKGALDERAQLKDGQAFDLSALDKEFTKLRAIAAEAGEGLAEIEELYGIKRQAITDKYAQEALDKERDRRELEIAVMAAEGDAAGALAAARALERQATEASLIPLKERLWALEDEAAAAAQAAAVAAERGALETRLWQLQGDTAALRARELAALDPANRSLLERIFALQDEAAAADAANRAAEAAAAIATERAGLETRLLQMQGDTAALRARELAALDPANRALLERIFALEDEAQAAQQAAQASAEAAAAQRAVADQRYGLEGRLLQAQGDTAALRARELAALDPSNRALLEQIFALEDSKAQAQAAADAESERARQIAEAKGALKAAYDREVSGLETAIEGHQKYAASLRAFRAEVLAGLTASDPAASYASARDAFMGNSRMAGLGSGGALQDFESRARAFLSASLASAASYQQYLDDVVTVASQASAAASGADGVASEGAAQIAALKEQVQGLVEIEEATLSVAEAVERLRELQAGQTTPAIETAIATGIDRLAASQDGLAAELATSRADADGLAKAVLMRLEEIASAMRQTRRADGWAVTSADSGPIPVTVTP